MNLAESHSVPAPRKALELDCETSEALTIVPDVKIHNKVLPSLCSHAVGHGIWGSESLNNSLSTSVSEQVAYSACTTWVDKSSDVSWLAGRGKYLLPKLGKERSKVLHIRINCPFWLAAHVSSYDSPSFHVDCNTQPGCLLSMPWWWHITHHNPTEAQCPLGAGIRSLGSFLCMLGT